MEVLEDEEEVLVDEALEVAHTHLQLHPWSAGTAGWPRHRPQGLKINQENGHAVEWEMLGALEQLTLLLLQVLLWQSWRHVAVCLLVEGLTLSVEKSEKAALEVVEACLVEGVLEDPNPRHPQWK